MTERADFDELILERIKVQALRYMSPEVASTLELRHEPLVQMVATDLWEAIRLRALIPGSKSVRVDHEERIPATWWEHLKQRLGMPHKVRVVPVHVTIYHTCPHVNFKPSPDMVWSWFRSVDNRLIDTGDVAPTLENAPGVRRRPGAEEE